MKTVFKNVTVLSPEPESDWLWQVLPNSYVVIEDAEITTVATGPVPEEITFDRVIDGQGGVLLPGFTNLHSHAPMALLRGLGEDLPLEEWLEQKIFPAEDLLEGDDYYWATKLAVAEMLLSGTTCFFDMYMGVQEMARAVLESGIRANLARGTVGDEISGLSRLAEAKSLYGEFQGADDGRVSVFLSPHSTYLCTPELLRIVAKEAEALGTGIHIHLSETMVENETVLGRYGKTPTQVLAETGLLELPVLAAHGVHLTADDIELLANAGSVIAHCPASNMKLASGTASLVDWRKKGLQAGIGTDGAASNNKLDLYEELRLAGYLQKVSSGNPKLIPAGYLLQRAVNPAPSGFGFLAPTGRIEPGYQADLQLVDFDKPHLQPVHDYISNLVYAAKGSDVSMVMVAGQIVVEKGQITTFDVEETLFEIGRRGSKLQV